MAGASELAAWGLRAEDFAANSSDELDIWPDNWSAITAFINLGTQWRLGMRGPTGLVYASIEPTLRLCRIPKREWPDVFQAIRAMERDALDVVSEQADD